MRSVFQRSINTTLFLQHFLWIMDHETINQDLRRKGNSCAEECKYYWTTISKFCPLREILLPSLFLFPNKRCKTPTHRPAISHIISHCIFSPTHKTLQKR
mmetsp:Transcript_15476/g.34760  ORF Transcript_15476/g.34760 Transcript_15476/m.34760 type:complete len:100 (+) Transcript_15476:1331-1630(+)